MKDVMILTGAGQIGMAIARRMGYGMKIVIGEKSRKIHRQLQRQSGHRMPALSAEADEQLAVTPTEQLPDLEILKPEA